MIDTCRADTYYLHMTWALFLQTITFLYGLGGIATFVGFFSTIIDLWRGKPSANIATYWTWTATTFITSLYGFFILQNLIFNIVINLQLCACVTVLALRINLAMTSRKRRTLRI